MSKAFLVGNFYSYLGQLVHYQLLDADPQRVNISGNALQLVWNALLPFTAVTRRLDPTVWQNFEYITALAQECTRGRIRPAAIRVACAI